MFRARIATVFRFLCLAGLAVLLSACASVLGPRTVTITQGELQQKLAAKFPQQQRVLELFNVTVATPSLLMQPQNNRVATELKVSVHNRLLNRDYAGVLGASFGLRFDPDAQALRLVNVSLDKLDLGGAPNVLGNVGRMLVEDQLEGYPIYRFKPEDLRTADRLGYTVGGIDVTAQGLLVHLQPKS